MRSVFDEIKDRLPITDVLATYLTLIPSGSQLKAKCPFHNERSASFSVSPERGLYYCFGCGAKGDIFTFVETFEGVDKKGALKILADRAGVVLTRQEGSRESTDGLYDVLEMATIRYEQSLSRTAPALEYLKSRGVTMETIKSFRIGYVSDEWRFIANTMTTDTDAAIAERAGLIKKTDKGYYDRFRKRVMFPLCDASGRVVGFSGRLYPSDAVGTANPSPKYLNSPETELFQKSRILFGFDKAKAAIRTHQFAIVVEGQMDCVLAHQAGFKNTVATSGTAVSDQAAADPTANLAVLARLTPNVFLAFDGDAAGQKALDRAAIVALRLGMNPRVVPLPAGVDPADYIQAHGAEGWKALLKESQHFIIHQVRKIHTHDMSAHVLVRTLKERIFPFLAQVVSPLEQSRYVETIAKELSVSQSDVAREFALYTPTEQPVVQNEKPVVVTDAISMEDRCIILVATYPSDRSRNALEHLAQLSFEEHHYTLPIISDERRAQLTLVIEREYGGMDSDERDMVVAEWVRTLEDQWYARVRMHYSRALEKAEQEGREDDAERIMRHLQIINTRRHRDT